MAVYVLLVKRILSKPNIGNGKLHRRVCIRQDGYPFVCVDSSAVVEVRTDIY